MDDIKDNFIKSFNLESFGNYHIFNDYIGFSVFKECDKKHVKVKNKKKYVSLIKIYLENNKNNKIEKIPIYIDVALCLYEDNKFYLNHDFIINKLSKPIDFFWYDEYFYNPNKNIFYKKNDEINPNKILEEVYMLHLKPTEPLKGLIIRAKLLINIFVKNLFLIINKLLNSILFIISGKAYSFNIYTQIFFDFKDKKEIEETESEKKVKPIKILGYPASFPSIFTYCLYHLIIYVLLFIFHIKLKPNFIKIIKIILKYNFLTLVYVISSITIYEHFLPKILKYLIKKISKFYYYFENKKFKI